MRYHEILAKYEEKAREYDWDAVATYLDEQGHWDPEWMDDYVDNPDVETLSVHDVRRINDVLLTAFERAHGKLFSGDYRFALANR